MTPTVAAIERPLAGLNGARPDAPDWYRKLNIEPAEILFPEVDGARLEVLVWGERGNPGVLLAHGSRAHARWWGPVAPLLARRYRVASLSFSGMGGSQWRAAYTLAQQVDELFGAAEAAGLFSGSARPIFAGHSFGARSVVRAAAERGESLSGAVLVDSAVHPNRRPPVPEKISDPRYPTLADGLARFNLRPPQACANLFLLDAIARASLEETSEGWRWRFDPEYYHKYQFAEVWPAIARPRARLAFIHGEDSLTSTPEELDAQMKHAPAGTPLIVIPDAGHHLMFDQPLAVAAAMQAIIAAWLQDGACQAQGSP